MLRSTLAIALSLLLLGPGCAEEPESYPEAESVQKKKKKKKRRKAKRGRKSAKGKKKRGSGARAGGKKKARPGGSARTRPKASAGSKKRRTTKKKPRTAKKRKPASRTPKRRPRLATERSRGSQVGLLEKASALVFTKHSHGSGFFVTPTVLVTNAHVVRRARAGQIFVTSEALGKVRKATLIAKTRSKAEGDYALLRVPDATGIRTLAMLSTLVRPLTEVVAAGFPGLVVETDGQFRALKRGDVSAAPNLVYSSGEVSVVQNPSKVALVAHTAKISGGNSGGPLVDQCGRVVGINSFIRYGSTAPSLYSYALGSPHLLAFMRKHNVKPVNVTRARCEADR